MRFVIAGLDPAPFRRFYGMSDDALAAEQVVRMTADSKPGFPCRVTLEDAEPGETLLLLNYEHLPAPGPYRSCHAIFVREGAETPALYTDEIPEQLATRLLSVRAFDCYKMMTNADVVEGNAIKPAIEAMLADPAVAFLHIHNAKRGCFAARVDRG
ncbi:hypothetical protein FHS95_004107 [Sphingomonas naasensis]|uniref:DUF1203 domain-containing protein n=1 Tax=Sphingomonas naasensis TaxID=1344951 RepID=A0A4S1WI92_9SPHN|nr:DUF1203 domain-containing protein [Sphingomonas naasensis]NIJ22392.1 hypothetical protein [Sphingomonas naasensis]TGX40616.1 DUF1203 domain-containing protein [Sphingomonas naasensis]